MNKRTYTRSSGFTLIELMIVVIVIAILTAVAYPSYLDSVRKARRADAQAALVEYASFAERIFTEAGSYATATEANSALTDNDFYNFSTAVAATTFTVTATAVNDQTNDPCGDMTLTNTGLTGAALGDCWQ